MSVKQKHCSFGFLSVCLRQSQFTRLAGLELVSASASQRWDDQCEHRAWRAASLCVWRKKQPVWNPSASFLGPEGSLAFTHGFPGLKIKLLSPWWVSGNGQGAFQPWRNSSRGQPIQIFPGAFLIQLRMLNSCYSFYWQDS